MTDNAFDHLKKYLKILFSFFLDQTLNISLFTDNDTVCSKILGKLTNSNGLS